MLVYQKLNDAGGQARVRLELAKINPGDSANLDTLYSSFAQKKDYKGMQAFFRGVAAQNPNSVNVHKYLLQAATKLGDNKSALHQLEQLIRLQPQQKEYHRLAAYLYEKGKNYDAAAKELQTVLKIDFKDTKAQQDYERVKLEQLEHGSLKSGQKQPAGVSAKAAAKPVGKSAKATAKLSGKSAKAKRPARRGTAAGSKKPPKKSTQGSD